MTSFSGTTLGELCVSDTWFDAKQAAARQARLHRACAKIKEPPLAPVNPHPPRLMGEFEIAELYHGRRYEDVRLKR